MNLSVMTNIKLYSISVRGSLDFNNLTTKFSTMLTHSYFNVSDNFSILYNLYWLIFVLWHILHF